MNLRKSVCVFAVCTALVTGVLSSATHATIINVPADQPTIQDGIDAAHHDDTVLVAPGLYTENIRFNGKRIVLTSQFLFSADPADIQSTIISGSAPTNPDSASVVLFINGEDARSVIQGFTIRDGTGTKWLDEHGAGLYVEGGGILCAFSSPTIRHNIITNNQVNDAPGVQDAGGGGIRAGDGSPRILHNLFTNNFGPYGGAIVLNFPGHPIVQNNRIAGNTSANAFGGGSIWVNTANTATIVQNNVIIGNEGGGGSAGLVSFDGTYVVRNNIIRGNTPPQFRPRSGGTFNVTYCDVEGGYTGTGNIDVDPAFTNLTDFYLSAGSPAIDAGNPAAVYNDIEDPNSPGNALFPGMGTVRNDMGAWGGPRPDEHDPDYDGVPDMSDNCPDGNNASQADADGDGWGDLCDRCTDTDGDGFGDPGFLSNTCPDDNCPNVPNPDQVDSDGDGVGDACDQCPGFDDNIDTDGDGIADGCDPCTDTDGDGFGNPGSLNTECSEIDNCPYFFNPYQEDSDGDGVGDSCSGPICISYANDAVCIPGEAGSIDIIVKNLEPVTEVVLPVHMTNVLSKFFLDSISFVGTRLDYFEYHQVVFDNRFSGGLVVRARADNGGGTPPLLPGHGPIARVHYRCRPNTSPGDTTHLDLIPQGTYNCAIIVPGDTLQPDFAGATVRVVSGCDCSYQSDLDVDGQLTSLDLSAVIDILFAGASDTQNTDCPSPRADFDCDGFSTALDLSALIDNLYVGGHGPCDPCAP